ncbi:MULTISPECIES: S8 family serine peptidase [Streptomyces]|uniref:S8 family serine peptidase n=1 Tax=Streptomyces edwardsiae TaxID=3075527 RepID=A0ABU2PRP6_9ACTN|nr:S8 family serine peptidase [Streptomyces sp. DSM 41636]MDT0394842.1 S8 family serine peptidase [Streptomyces sp. DSM 41636]
MRRMRIAAAVAAGLALSAGAMPPVAADPGGTPGPATSPAPAPAGATVRLITGDRVTVHTGADGRRTASVVPGEGRRHILFRTIEEDGRLTVLPSDAAGLVTAGRLDRGLFDVTGLLEQRYDEAHTDALPLIVGDGPSVADATLRRLTALAADGTPARRLETIDADAVRVPAKDLGAFWKRLAPAAGDASRAAAVPRVWLDGRVRASLDRSTAQIGAPEVWKAGFEGDDVKVAVLDTGADTGHPDLAGRVSEAEDFSGSSGTGDVFGHGTHVASIVGGSGAASGGSRKGVAPGADLLIGKVLGDDGFGTASQVIDGMEWAVARGAGVVNMSLGSDAPSDGTDPMSVSLNELSARSGALFVVASGNAGPGRGTIGSPAAADAALTVGAVDRDDSLADFSSRGPRPGDAAVKPDVTAPGVGIVAARAAGTTMGEVVDARYVAASGTSMATPHVAGAAALLAQRHPDWTAGRLKDALTSTARTVGGQLVTEQGGGRVDVAAAVRTPVVATATLALGTYGADDTGTVTRTVRYTNTSAEDVTLELRAALATSGGRQITDGAVTPDRTDVTVPAGGTAEVPLTVNPARAQRGDYYGHLTAASADGSVTVHTTLSLIVNGPVHKLKVVSYDNDGRRIHALPTVWGANGFVEYTDRDNAVAEVEEGTYQLTSGGVERVDGKEVLRQVVLPEIKVTRDTTVVVDPRKTVKVEIRTPRPAEQSGILSYQTYRQIDGHGWIDGTMYFDLAEALYISPTAEVTDGIFEFASRWQLVAPLLEAGVVGGTEDLGAYYMPRSPLLDQRGERLRAVAAGTTDAPDFRRARGRLAVVTDETGVAGPDLAERAAAAGARAVLVVHFNDNGWTRWTPDGERWKVPVVRVGARAGADLLKRIERRATTVAFGGTARSPYLYDVMQVSEQRIPDRVVHTVSERNSAVVRSVYADNGGVEWAAEQRFARRPYQDFAWLQYTRHVPTAFTRTEYVSSGTTEWDHVVLHQTVGDVDSPLNSGLADTPRTYRAGERVRETWQGAVVRPSIPRAGVPATTRDGNVLRLRIPEFTDSAAGHWSRLLDGGTGIGVRAPSADTADAELFRDGEKITGLADAWRDVEVPSGAADYRLRLTTSRESAEWNYATATDTSWTFRSGPSGEEARLPLLQVDYDVPVDAHNAVGPGRAYTLGLTVRNQDGLGAPRGVRTVVEVSYDDGRHFTRVPVRAKGGNVFSAEVRRPAAVRGDTPVTLRVTAGDSAGNSVRQTVTRAYLHRG